MRIFLCLVSVGLLVSCASTPPICKPHNARLAGMSQAKRSEPFNPAMGSVCVDEDRGIFRKHFELGYQEGKAQLCRLDEALKDGRAQGNLGRQKSFEGGYSICEDQAGLKQSYHRGYTEGLTQYCKEDEASAQGFASGEKGAAESFNAQRYTICGRTGRYQQAYQRAYRKGLRQYCQGSQIPLEALEDGENGESKRNIAQQFSRCSLNTQAKLQSVYDLNYAKGYERFCRFENIRMQARVQAENRTQGSFPAKYLGCLEKHPGFEERFHQAFEVARENVVTERCTYDAGETKGRRDAAASNYKDTQIPNYCDRDLYNVYLNGYLAGWQAIKDEMCNITGAYNQGTEDARWNRPRDFVLPSGCPSEYRARLETHYIQGYRDQKKEMKRQRRQQQRQFGGLSYPPKKARKVCRNMGYSKSTCRHVTSVACLKRGYSPMSCAIDSHYMLAVDACIRRGYKPRRCRKVKDIDCIRSGRKPNKCRWAS